MPDLADGGNSHKFQASASFSERKCLLQDDKVCKKAYREIPEKVYFLSDKMVIRKACRKAKEKNMNKIYKLVWSKVKGAWVVTSEIAKGHGKSVASRQRKSIAAAMAVLALGFIPGAAYAAPDGVKTFVEPGNQNIKIGNGISLPNDNGKNGAVAIGDHVKIDDYVMQEGSIAIGKNAFVENMYGNQEKNFKFNQQDITKWASSIAIGQNAYARSGSTMIGDHKYIGKLGDTEVDGSNVLNVKSKNVNINATTIGANSYNQGAFSSVLGTYSIISGKYNGSKWSSYGTQNMGASIVGSLNSIESAGSSSNLSGIANSVVGVANRTNNANGALIFGAGNEIENSIGALSGIAGGGASAKDFADTLRKTVKSSNGGGAVLAIGGGNKANYAKASQLMGVNNTLTGAENAASDYNLLNGFKNVGTNISHVSVIGSENQVTDTKNALVFGDKRKLTKANGSIVLGVSDTVKEIKVEDVTVIGHNALATGTNAVAIGRGAKADSSSTVAIGDDARVASNTALSGGVAIGKSAYVLNGVGRQEKYLGFGTTNDPQRSATGVAIGANSYARTGSIQIGAHTYLGKMGGADITAKTNGEGNHINQTTVGTNTFNKGVFGTMIGSYSISTGNFTGAGGFNSLSYGGQNFGSTIAGSLNTIQSKGHSGSAGISNSIVGLANMTENTNGTLIFGAGNKVTNSIKSISGLPNGVTSGAATPDELIEKLRKMTIDNESGGSTMVVGGGNTADYTMASQIMGVNNTLTGTEDKVSTYNLVDGFKNKAENVTHVTMIGSDNEVKDTTGAVLLGDKRKLTGADGSIVLGSSDADDKVETNVKDATVIGHNANTTVASGVALGSGSVADRAGFTEEKKGVFSDVDLNGITAAAVSVGTKDKLRQIINVGDATEDTDAVNLRQLRALSTKVDKGGVHYLSVNSKETGEGSNYKNDGAKAKDSIVLGVRSSSEGINGVVVGNDNKLTGTKNDQNNSVVIGTGLNVDGVHNIVVGTNYENYDQKATKVKGEHNTVIGNGNLVGYTAVQDPNDATKWKYTEVSTSGSDRNVAVGSGNTANGSSVAVGTSLEVEDLGRAFGSGNKVIGSNNGGGQWGLALGSNNTVKGEMAVSVGTETNALGDYTVSIGSEAKTNASQSIAMGYQAETGKGWSAAIGSGAKTTGTASTAVGGLSASATVDYGAAFGSYSVAQRASGVAGYLANGQKTMAWESNLGAFSVGDDVEGYSRQITGVAAGSEDTDAVNVAQLKAVESKITQAGAGAQKHTSVTEGTNISVTEDGTNKEGGKNYKVSLAKDIDLGQDGSIKAGNTIINKDGVTTNTVKAGDTTINNNGVTIKDGPVITKTNVDVNNQQIHHVKDGTADDDAATVGQVNKKIDEITKTVAGSSVTGGTIGEDGKISLTKADKTTVELQGQLKDISARAGDYEIKDNKVTIGLEDNYSKNAAGNIVIKDVAKASALEQETKERKDADKVITETIGAANKDELKTSYQNTTYIKNSTTLVEADKALDKAIGKNAGDIKKNTETINILGKQVGNLDTRVNRVGAGAAALAALHPLDFDPDDKWDFAAGYGNYKGANAAAIGAYYRPNEDTMFSVGGSFGGGENMVNAGVSVKLGQGNHVSTSKVAMAKDMLAMQKRMAEMEAQMAKMQGFIGALTGMDTQAAMFPDVPENHWAYEYVKGLCEKGIIEGYPDGNFNGNRSMTRYEFAAMLYRALAKGVNLDARAVKEFAPELGRIRVDVISQNKEGQPVIERVRVNEEKKDK